MEHPFANSAAPRTAEAAFDLVGDALFPRWNRKPWTVRVENPTLADGLCGLCDWESKTIYLPPETVSDDRTRLLLTVTHEVCHAVTHSGHGKRFRERLRKAAKDAEKTELADLADLLRSEADFYEPQDDDPHPLAYLYGLVDDTLIDHPEATWPQVRFRIASAILARDVEEVEIMFPTMEAYYRNRRRFYNRTKHARHR